MRRTFMFPAAGCAAALALGGGLQPVSASGIEVIDRLTPWRVHVTMCRGVVRGPDGLVLVGGHKKVKFDAGVRDQWSSPFPPADWMVPAYDDLHWGRYQEDLFELLGDYGYWRGEWHNHPAPALVHLRTRFGVADPVRANDLKLSLVYLGGVVVYVNGQEAARGHMPKGPIEPETLAEDYPIEAYVTEDGKTPLPHARRRPADKWRERYEKRIRTLCVTLPPKALVKGGNLLAISLHRAAYAGPMREAWGHVGVLEIQLTSAGGAGGIPYAEAVKGTYAWNANAADTVADRRQEKIDRKSTAGGGVFAHAYPAKGLTVGNPFDPLGPVKMVGARNGSASGQVVLSDPAGIQGVTAKLGPLARQGVSDVAGAKSDGATIPASAVTIRYAVQQAGSQYCDALMEAPPAQAAAVPVWMIVEISKNQAPGWYAGTLTLSANGRTFTVPVRLLVCGYALPDPKEFRSTIALMQSPDTVAAHYGVEPWSDRHFALLEPSLALLGQVGNDVIYAPVILDSHMGCKAGLIRWVKADGVAKPEFGLLEKFLDLYLKYCPPPQAICVNLWEPKFAPDSLVVYEHSLRPQLGKNKAQPLRVTVVDSKTGATSDMAAPIVGAEGSEAFYRTLLDGVRAVVAKRGWPDRIVLIGTGFDNRPTPQQVELLKQWAPFARWNVYSHFGDPGPKPDGRWILHGGIEVGLGETVYAQPQPAMYPEDAKVRSLQCLRLGAHRFSIHQESSPNSYRNLVLGSGGLARHGLDFWPVAEPKTRRGHLFNPQDFWRIWNDVPWCLTAPGPKGGLPTVRFQMLREAVQETEARIAIQQALAKMTAEAKKTRLDQLRSVPGWINEYLPQAQLSLDPLAGVALVYRVAGELTGAKADAPWNEPPK